jgi:Uri superfamily endonuclease
MKGVYCLLISVPEDSIVSVGSLGKVSFHKGFYVYVGSAQNNMEKRIERHLNSEKIKKWHIDYLLSIPGVDVKKVICKEVGKSKECKIAKAFELNRELVEGFGCSDCKCSSHLFKVRSISEAERIIKAEI